MIGFRKLIDDGIATEQRLLEDMRYVIKNPDAYGSIPDTVDHIFFEKSFIYGRMRVDAKLVDGVSYDVDDAYILYVSH